MVREDNIVILHESERRITVPELLNDAKAQLTAFKNLAEDIKARYDENELDTEEKEQAIQRLQTASRSLQNVLILMRNTEEDFLASDTIKGIEQLYLDLRNQMTLVESLVESLESDRIMRTSSLLRASSSLEETSALLMDADALYERLADKIAFLESEKQTNPYFRDEQRDMLDKLFSLWVVYKSPVGDVGTWTLRELEDEVQIRKWMQDVQSALSDAESFGLLE